MRLDGVPADYDAYWGTIALYCLNDGTGNLGRWNAEPAIGLRHNLPIEIVNVQVPHWSIVVALLIKTGVHVARLDNHATACRHKPPCTDRG